MANAKVLIVDDETEFSAVIAERLQARGFAVDTAESGPDGIAKVKETAYDAIILDLAMPGMDGIETLQEMLKIDQTLQIILLTGHATLQKGIEAVKLGASDFLEKPADIDALVGKVNEAQQKRIASFQENLEKKMSDIMKKKGW